MTGAPQSAAIRPAAALVIALALVAPLAAGAASSPPPTGAPAPAIPGISGRFSLKTTDGRVVTQASFPGKWLVVYFGYTQCPDACPTALAAIAAALGQLGPVADRVQPLFVTVDPRRDTAQLMADYVKAFAGRILALRGDDAETAAAAKAFHVYYSVRNLGQGEYAIDHSSFIYIVAPDHRVVELLEGNLRVAAMAAALRRLLQ